MSSPNDHPLAPTPALPSEERIDSAAENFIRAASEYFVHSELSIDAPISYSVMFLKARKELRQALAVPSRMPARTATAEPEPRDLLSDVIAEIESRGAELQWRISGEPLLSSWLVKLREVQAQRPQPDPLTALIEK